MTAHDGDLTLQLSPLVVADGALASQKCWIEVMKVVSRRIQNRKMYG
jgi:hypothetical protein